MKNVVDKKGETRVNEVNSATPTMTTEVNVNLYDGFVIKEE